MDPPTLYAPPMNRVALGAVEFDVYGSNGQQRRPDAWAGGKLRGDGRAGPNRVVAGSTDHSDMKAAAKPVSEFLLANLTPVKPPEDGLLAHRLLT